ncbi:alpha/beta hydrolase family protein [Erythrobacter dokdonensis]|uniref:Dipeptidyl anminopeptidase n=1 Tax=Erythrobacter dokdonensis DSW-74 TaxID=1300349 RepID=A0A1A7BC94_9SPHN|nr:S9 family peptidase [Erythrobacter dokdonensis]OBV10119.1 Dipeptidyl anminopeptidase [Erythrobacter dokdonensis DSW-74]
MQTRFARLLAGGVAAAALTLPGLASADSHTAIPSAMTGAAMTNESQAAPLIPRSALFGNPTRASGQISPDGQWLSWLAPKDGVLNIWLAPVDNPDAARAMTSAADRPIRQYFWSPDSRAVMYIQDKGGDENFLLYSVDVASGAETTVTPFTNTRVEIIGASNTIKDKLLLGINNRDPQWHDVYLLDIPTGELTLVMENNAYAGFMADDSLTLRMAMSQNEAGGTDYFRVEGNTVESEPFETTAMEDSLTTGPAGYTTDGGTLYWIDSRGRNTAALFAQDTATGAKRLIAEDDKADIGSTLRDPQTGEVEAYAVDYLTTEWHATDPETRASLDWLDQQLEGEFGVSSRTDDDRTWIVWNDPLTKPAATFIYDRAAQTLTPFYISRPELEGAPLVPMHPVEITSRDGLILPSYLTLPPMSDSDGDGRPDQAVPMVLLVHGGPWARDGYGFNSLHQMLANRGYGVLSVNFRGSTGFGKDFINAGNKQWGLTMHDDLIDAVDWAVAEGIAQPDKVAIMGGSYGGYATLAGLTFTPQTFACGVDIVGPSNLETLLASIPPYWAPMVKIFHERMGDPGTEEGRALLRAASPLYKADRIEKPLLIAQGANDPRVKQAESDQIVDAMKSAGIPVTYVLYPDEGHGFARPENNIAFFAIAENFLAECIGGRAEPLGDALKPSSARIIEGEEHVKGLEAALAS